MGSIKLAAHLEKIAGKVGTGVYATNRGGPYLREKVTPANPNTSYQQTARGYLSTASAAWKTRTDGERLSWEVLAVQLKAMNRVGIEYTRSGFSAYVQCYCNALITGGTPLTTAPALLFGATLTSMSATVTAGVVTAVFAPSPVPTGNKMVARATSAVSQGRNFVKNFYRKIKVIAAAQTTPQALATEWNARFGAGPATGERVGIELFNINTVTFLPGNVLNATDIA
jgi:hypothetical protein